MTLQNLIYFFPRNSETLAEYIQYAQKYLTFDRNVGPLDFVGNNWKIDDDKPVAILWGYPKWKREFVSQFLVEYKTVFVYGRRPWRLVQRHLDELALDDNTVIVGWGRNLSKKAQDFAKKSGFSIYNMEDGFLRSFNPGALHTQPYSQVLDKTGIYFDATNPSDLENILQNQDFTSDENLMKEAQEGLTVMRAAHLSKYYSLTDQDFPTPFKRNENYSILIVGQMDGDASIKYGCSRKMKSTDLIKEARREYPEADIYYRPHPDEQRNLFKFRLKSRLRNLVAQLYDGAAGPLVLQLVRSERLKPEEIKELQKLIEDLDRDT